MIYFNFTSPVSSVEKKELSVEEFLDYDMKQKLIHSITFLPIPDTVAINTYKIMPRGGV